LYKPQASQNVGPPLQVIWYVEFVSRKSKPGPTKYGAGVLKT